MKIAIYGETFPPDGSGGIAAAHWQLGRLLQDSHHVRYFAFADGRKADSPDIIRASRESLQGKVLAWLLTRFIRRFDQFGRLSYCPRIAQTIPPIRRLNRHLAKFQPDIVIVSDNCLPLLAMHRMPNAAAIWVAHQTYARFRNQPLINGPCDYDCFLAHRLERRAVRKANYVVFTSQYMEGVFRESLGPSPEGSVIPNVFVPPSEHATVRRVMRAQLGLGENDILVYFPSGATDIKGGRYVPAILQRLAQEHLGLSFYVSGPVPEEAAWQFARMNNGAKVIAPGRLDYAENLRYVAASDLAISPAIMENYSCALLEAQSFGIPCVTFDVGGNREIIADGTSGFVVPYLDVNALCLAAGRLLASRSLLDRMRQNAVSRAAELCDLGRARQLWDDVIISLSRQWKNS